jgi:hypothetical protein
MGRVLEYKLKVTTTKQHVDEASGERWAACAEGFIYFIFSVFVKE